MGTNKGLAFAEIIGKFLGKKFKIGGTSEGGYDCLGLTGRICQLRGLDFPEKFKEWDINSYAKLYQDDPDGSIDIAFDFFNSFAEKVDINRIVAGDILIMEQPKEKIRFLALYTGNMQAITSFIRTGVSVFPINEANICTHAWRPKCQLQQD